MKNRYLIGGFLLFLSLHCNSFANADDYKFDPHDPHHYLFIPNEDSKSPAILLLHASTGIEKVNHDWAVRLKNDGYVVFMIDSFTPRGWKDRRSVGWEKATQAQLEDVVPAFNYLSHLSFVDPKRIGILGFSMGGFTVLKIMEKGEVKAYQQLPFKAAASFYGVCHRLAEGTQLKPRTKIFIGSEDDRATTQDCIELVDRSNEKDSMVQVYPDALHGFDNFEFPPIKEVIDEKGEHYHIGFNEAARIQALNDLPEFFNHYLKNK